MHYRKLLPNFKAQVDFRADGEDFGPNLFRAIVQGNYPASLGDFRFYLSNHLKTEDEIEFCVDYSSQAKSTRECHNFKAKEFLGES